jgi:hypothetical protein
VRLFADVKQFTSRSRRPVYQTARTDNGAPVPSLDRANRNNDSYWSGILGILTIQLAVLFAVFVAAIVYLNWSSNAALAEFIGAGRSSASDNLQQSPPPVQHAKRRTACARRA